MEKINGLTEERVLEFKQKFGDNSLSMKDDLRGSEILISQFKSPLIYILIFVVIVSIFLKEFTDALLASVVLILNVSMGFYQEYRAEKTLAALRKFIRPTVMVIRNGKRVAIEAKDIVPLDIVVLGAGDKIPADGHLISSSQLLVNEAILTGEDEALPKSLDEKLFMGSTILSGKGLMQVNKIGQATEFGKISESLSEIKDEKTPLQKRIEKFSKNLVYTVLAICVIIFIFGIFKHENVWEMFRIAIVLAIAAIPEGLLIAITVILALGMRRILKKNGLVRKLLSIETLGSTSIICTDKTGTLTEGSMRVVNAEFKDKEKALKALALVNEQKTNLEIALWEYVKASGQDPQAILDKLNKLDEEPFDSEKKYSLAVVEEDAKDVVYLLGAPEIVLSFCQIDPTQKTSYLEKIDAWASKGLRILAIAFKNEGNLLDKTDYKILGLVGIQDPIRSEVKESIRIARNAGIKIKIVTGDYGKTAEFVGRNLGFEINPESTIEGVELEKLSDKELAVRIEKIQIFSRVSPHQKLKIVKILQEQGEIVAMTGDGVNDAPALKKADIGLVVGNGTEVAKESADLVLLDSNFKTIVSAVEEGRLILANIKKVVGYTLSNAFVEIILIFGAILLGFAAPLTVVQILWIQLICDGPPDIMLGFEPKSSQLMNQNPKSLQREEILSWKMKILIVIISGTVGLLSLWLFRYYLANTGNLDLARTIAFSAVSSVSLIYIFAFKDLNKSIFATENFWQNKYLIFSVIYGFALILVAVYVPFFNKILKTVPLNFFQWLLIISIGLIAIVIIELLKFMQRKYR
jgi:Ca2+-transporting ATPase